MRLATMEGIASLYLAPRLNALSETAPNLRLELVTSPQVIHVNRREADLFLSFFKPPGQGLVSQKLGFFTIHLYGTEAYFARNGRPASVDELKKHDFITYIDDLVHVDSVRWHRDLVEDVPTVFTSNSMIAQMTAAAAGLGLVVLPKFAVCAFPTLQPVLPEVLQTQRELWLNVHQDLQFSSRLKAVVGFLEKQIRSDMTAGRL